jgi:hypothetical protein
VQGRPPDWSGVGLKRLQARYPLLTDSLLAGIGVRQLTANQADAVARILGADQDPALRGRRDFVFAGWPGSGRTSLCNLLTLAALMHREGAVHCISPESPQRGVSGKTAGEGGHSTRHPVGQLRRWLAGTRFAEKVQESYDAPVPRSRDRRLTWPFTLRDALQAFGLEHEALTGRFDGVDVVVERGGDVPGGEGSLSETSDAGPDRGNEP